MKLNFSQIQAISQAKPRTVRWPGFLFWIWLQFSRLIIRFLYSITPVPTTQNTIPRREPTRRFAFWKLGLSCVLLVSQQVNGQAFGSAGRVSPGKTHSDHVQSPPDHCSLRSQTVAKFAHPALTKQPGPRHPWRVRSSALEPVAPKRAFSPGKYNVTDEANKNRSWTFDLQGRVLSETTPDGTEYRTYADLTRTWEVTNRRGFKTKYEADAMGRVLKMTHPNASTEEFTYDANVNRLTAKDRVGTITTTTYDALDRDVEHLFKAVR